MPESTHSQGDFTAQLTGGSSNSDNCRYLFRTWLCWSLELIHGPHEKQIDNKVPKALVGASTWKAALTYQRGHAFHSLLGGEMENLPKDKWETPKAPQFLPQSHQTELFQEPDVTSFNWESVITNKIFDFVNFYSMGVLWSGITKQIESTSNLSHFNHAG